jgi:hypothetical protein
MILRLPTSAGITASTIHHIFCQLLFRVISIPTSCPCTSHQVLSRSRKRRRDVVRREERRAYLLVTRYVYRDPDRHEARKWCPGPEHHREQDLITVGGLPEADLAANFIATPLGGNAPLRVTFTDTSTGEPAYWSYTFGDGTTSSSKNPTHTYLVPGKYTVNLTVLKPDGGNLIRNMTVHHDLINVT